MALVAIAAASFIPVLRPKAPGMQTLRPIASQDDAAVFGKSEEAMDQEWVESLHNDPV